MDGNRCRCGHGRGAHRKNSGKLKLPCQFLVATGKSWPASTHDKCKCRDFKAEAVPA